MEGNIVDLGPVLGYLIQIIAAALVVVAMWAVKRLGGKLGLDIDARQREVIYTAIEGAVGWGAMQARLKGENLAKVNVKNELIHVAADYLVQRVPDAIRHFKLSPADVEQLVASRLEVELPEPSALSDQPTADS